MLTRFPRVTDSYVRRLESHRSDHRMKPGANCPYATRVLSFLFLSLIASIPLLGSTPEVMSATEAVKNHLLVRVVPLEYDYEARARQMEGRGVFDLVFDYETGHLREVHVVEALPSSRLQKTT